MKKERQAMHSGEYRFGFYKNEVEDFQFMRALSYAAYDAASPGEIVYIARMIEQKGNTRQIWIDQWIHHAELVERRGERLLNSGNRESARNCFLTAYNYYRSAEFYYYRADPAGHRDLYRKSVGCFEKGLSLTPYDWEKISIPYSEGIHLPGYFFRAENYQEQPTVIINGGGDSSGEESFFLAGVPEALDRGLNALVFHGPGHRGVLIDQPDHPFRPDWEHVVTPVIDYAISDLNVHSEKIALYGYSLGGYFAPRAAAFDDRIAALVPNAPIINFRDLVLGMVYGQMPAFLWRLIGGSLEANNEFLWDKAITSSFGRDWVFEATIELYMLWTNGVSKMSEYMESNARYSLDGLCDRIKCPTLVVQAEGEGGEPDRQVREFLSAIRCEKEMISLETEFGADNHCGLNNIPYTSAIVYDWIKKTFLRS